MRLIDADALIKRLKEDWPQTSKISWAQIVAKCAPTIDAEPVKHGEWKCMADCGVTECDQCGWSIEKYVGDYNFCPNCGAKMKKTGNDAK